MINAFSELTNIGHMWKFMFFGWLLWARLGKESSFLLAETMFFGHKIIFWQQNW